MADRKWIERIVDTSGRFCPLRGTDCLGNRKSCTFWITETITDLNSRDHDVVEGCMFAFQYVMQNEARVEGVRTQATLQHAANIVHQAGREVAVALRRRLVDDRPAAQEGEDADFEPRRVEARQADGDSLPQ